MGAESYGPPPGQYAPPKGRSPWLWIGGCLACGCVLVVLVVVLMLLGLVPALYFWSATPEVEPSEPAQVFPEDVELGAPQTEAEPSGEEDVPDIYQPGEEVAKEAALMDTPDWVAKVVEHSSDWKSVTVWVGPPQSEFVAAVRLQWNDEIDCYEVAGTEEIPYP